ncbi:glycosyltransferase family 4 protein [Salinigranum rubrum]|uniref:glycosyltransferase family 4 protein n=1 Tax=Salinigranum rubrum TaxID=755307 RepID=UPI00268784E5|nr:glycosyltransferase family 4 protein [Salinigranum rubrum]
MVFVSNLIERKGVRELVTALGSVLADDRGSLRVDIAGDGPLSDLVESLAEEHQRVTYHGYVSEERKRALLERGSVYVLPSYAEGLPIALLEGMAGGNAAVATTVGSIPEVVDDRSGRLVEPGDDDALAAALESLVASPTTVQEMARRNRSLIETRYSWERVVTQLVEAYESA